MYIIHTSTLNIKVAKIAQTAHNYPPMRSSTSTGIFKEPGDSNLFQTSDFVWTSPGAFFLLLTNVKEMAIFMSGSSSSILGQILTFFVSAMPPPPFFYQVYVGSR